MQRVGANIILIQDHHNHVLGAYLNNPIKIQKQFYGNGEIFLFQLVESQIASYKWSYKNSYFIYADQDGFGVGMGYLTVIMHREGYGIYVDSQLDQCQTSATLTFDSPRLNTRSRFGIKNLEIWALPEDIGPQR